MKTQVIQLEPHDDLVSARDMMSWAKTPRILLVWPRAGGMRLRPLDLTLLRRHAASFGAQLGLVAKSAAIRRAAQEQGIPVFASTAGAQRGHWRVRLARPKPQRRLPRPDLKVLQAQARPSEPAWRARPAVRLTFFSLGVLSVLAVLLLFLPSAEIALLPEIRSQVVILPVNASPDFQSVNLSGSVPARSMTVLAEGGRTLTITNEAPVPDRAAQGMVRFRNLTGASVVIPAGTVVRARGESPVRFATTRQAEVSTGQTVDVPVQALLLGSAGNLEAGALQVIEGSLGLSLAVTNPEPTSGGSDRLAPFATADDRTRLYGLLYTDLRRAALADMQATLVPGDILFPDTLTISQTLAEIYDPPAGQAGSQLTLTLRLEFQAFYTSASDLEVLARALLDASLPAGFAPETNAIIIEPASEPVTGSDGVTRWQLRAERAITAQIGPTEVISLIRGLSPAKARQRLESTLLLASPPRITLVPSWWPFLPVIPFRITIERK